LGASLSERRKQKRRARTLSDGENNFAACLKSELFAML
jgi:hypothetical protein